MDINLAVGFFFDGTSNNANNLSKLMKVSGLTNRDLNTPACEEILKNYADHFLNLSGLSAMSYTGYLTNIYWLEKLYCGKRSEEKTDYQHAIYIEGIGTESDQPDSLFGQAFGVFETGVIAKTDKAIAQLSKSLKEFIENDIASSADEQINITSLQFDVFGFSRGAVAARHFVNRYSQSNNDLLNALHEGLKAADVRYEVPGKIRFLGLFDTVAAMGTPCNGLNIHSGNTGEVELYLSPESVETVFHITANNECRYNFALNSVKPSWPELSLPGAHADIGGGYLPVINENFYLTRPERDIKYSILPGQEMQVYQRSVNAIADMLRSPSISPIVKNSRLTIETWYGDKILTDDNEPTRKYRYSAVMVRNRVVRNDWSKVILRVMIEAAKEAGIWFKPVSEFDDLSLPDELLPLLEKALYKSRSVRMGYASEEFTREEFDFLAAKYIHCSSNWNSEFVIKNGHHYENTKLLDNLIFTHRPDELWQRTIYDMDGNPYR